MGLRRRLGGQDRSTGWALEKLHTQASLPGFREFSVPWTVARAQGGAPPPWLCLCSATYVFTCVPQSQGTPGKGGKRAGTQVRAVDVSPL